MAVPLIWERHRCSVRKHFVGREIKDGRPVPMFLQEHVVGRQTNHASVVPEERFVKMEKCILQEYASPRVLFRMKHSRHKNLRLFENVLPVFTLSLESFLAERLYLP